MGHPIQNILERAGVRINGSRPWDISVHDERLWRRVLLYGNVGLGEAYMDGWWDCEAVDELIHRVLKVVSFRQRQPWRIALAGSILGRLFNLQSLGRAFQVGERHYDIGNDLYEAMLGKDMVYSCGYWQAGSKTLAEAQNDKMKLVCNKLLLKPGMRLLDIGCGWGSLCRYAAEHYGVEAVGITVSKEQVRHARSVQPELPVEFHLQDYRTYNGAFDRVVSIGMFEHVGPKNYGIYMDVVRKCLPPEGLFLLHSIGSNVTSNPGRSWYTKHIFPNGYIPSFKEISQSIEGHFIVEDFQNFGPDYDLTLMAWYKNFEEAWPALKHSKAHYDGRFYRMWRYYLLSCAGAFRARDQQVWQWVLSPHGEPGGYTRPVT